MEGSCAVDVSVLLPPLFTVVYTFQLETSLVPT